MDIVLNNISIFALPVLIIFIILYGAKRQVKVYDTFVEGAGEGVKTIVSILPNLIALMAAVSVFKSSGILDGLINLTAGALQRIGFIPETLPVALIRPLSGSGSLAFLTDIFEHYGVDSLVGRTASVMVGTTETIFYTVAVYVGSVGIKKTRFLIPLTVSIDCFCYIVQTAVCRAFFL